MFAVKRGTGGARSASTATINNQIEREVDDIEVGKPFPGAPPLPAACAGGASAVGHESWTWGVTGARDHRALVLILVDFTQSPAFTAGAIYAVLAYIYDYLEGLNQVPTVVNSLARLRDVRRDWRRRDHSVRATIDAPIDTTNAPIGFARRGA
jgi:hypothetical protein